MARSLAIMSCKSTVSKESAGKIIGAIQGAAIGTQIGKGKGKLAAIAAGTFLGSLIGGEIGRKLDEEDREIMTNTAQQTLENEPTGSTKSWKNPESGHSGTVTPTRTYKKKNGQPCREFSQTVADGKGSERKTGTACRQTDGTWILVKG